MTTRKNEPKKTYQNIQSVDLQSGQTEQLTLSRFPIVSARLLLQQKMSMKLQRRDHTAGHVRSDALGLALVACSTPIGLLRRKNRANLREKEQRDRSVR